MLILGHLGCALAATQVGETAYKRVSSRRLNAAAKLIDYRFLAVGALLPDLIDKPLSWFILPGLLDGISRNFGHTLLFSLLLLAIWQLVPGRRLNFLLPLAIGSALHLLLDGMFSLPTTLLWPFMGWDFVAGGHTNLFSSIPIPWTLPWLEFSELLGGLYIAHTLFNLWRERSQGVHVRTRRSPVLLQTLVAPPN